MVAELENVIPLTVRGCTLSGRSRVLNKVKGNHQARWAIIFPKPVTTDRLRLEMPSRQKRAPAAIF